MIDLTPYIVPVLGPIAVILIQSYFVKSRKDQARLDETTGDQILEYGKGMKSLPLIAAVVVAVLVFVLLYARPVTKENAGDFSLVVGLLTVPWILAAIIFYGVHHRITKDGIQKGSPWSKGFFVRWDEIEEVYFNGTNFIVSTPKGKIGFHLYLTGLNAFARAVRDRLPEAKWTKAREQINSMLS